MYIAEWRMGVLYMAHNIRVDGSFVNQQAIDRPHHAIDEESEEGNNRHRANGFVSPYLKSLLMCTYIQFGQAVIV